jgi:hypothetical protein
MTIPKIIRRIDLRERLQPRHAKCLGEEQQLVVTNMHEPRFVPADRLPAFVETD